MGWYRLTCLDDVIILDRVTVNIVIVFGKSFDEHLRNMEVVLHDSRTGGGVEKSVLLSENWNALSGSEELCPLTFRRLIR